MKFGPEKLIEFTPSVKPYAITKTAAKAWYRLLRARNTPPSCKRSMCPWKCWFYVCL